MVGLLILVKPGIVLTLANRYSNSLALFVSAIGVRLVIGIALLMYAEQSRYPVTLTVLGWLFLAGAIAIAIMGRDRLRRLIEWIAKIMAPYVRIAGILAVCFGGFIAYAVL
ncbi:MAG: hypothetical protein HKN88_00665 [Gammaproteobacteria bacterium]|nr:hypothetical protein [Gammaproteobacteria bacterium]